VLQSEGDDQLAAAVPLLDVARHPLGGGPFLLEAYRPGDSLELRRHDGHMPVEAGSERLRLRIIRDPSTAATALRGGQVDWLVEVQPDQAVALEAETGLVVAAHPEPSVRSIIFNVRPGRVFRDAVARRAVVLCVDRTALVAQATDGTALPSAVEMAPASWAAAGAVLPDADPERASAELEDAGWSRGADGIFQRGGVRLSTEIHVRPTRLDLLTFARGASEQLRACGIELVVQELEQTGDLLLAQLQWPNDFETVLVARPLGVDPDIDAAAFEGSHATSRDNPGDANPGGYSSATVDRLLAEARATADQEARADLYAEMAEQLVTDPPSLPLWYDPAFAALSSRVERAADAGSVDPGQPRYWWDAWTWRLAPP
jgi:peptide/nickel transport system substrate-binding protein